MKIINIVQELTTALDVMPLNGTPLPTRTLQLKSPYKGFIQIVGTELSFNDCNFTDSDFDEIISLLEPMKAKLGSLVRLGFMNCSKISRIPNFSFVSSLKGLEINFCTRITDIQSISQYTNLEMLNIGTHNSNTLSLPALAENLESITLSASCYTIENIKHIAKLQHAKKIFNNRKLLQAAYNNFDAELFKTLLALDVQPNPNDYDLINCYLAHIVHPDFYTTLAEAIKHPSLVKFLSSVIGRQKPCEFLCKLPLDTLNVLFSNKVFFDAALASRQLFSELIRKHSVTTLIKYDWFTYIARYNIDLALEMSFKANIGNLEFEQLFANSDYLDRCSSKCSLLEHASFARRLYVVRMIFETQVLSAGTIERLLRIAVRACDMATVAYIESHQQYKDSINGNSTKFIETWSILANMSFTALQAVAYREKISVELLERQRASYILKRMSNPVIYKHADLYFERYKTWLVAASKLLVPKIFVKNEALQGNYEAFFESKPDAAMLHRLLMNTLIKFNSAETNATLKQLLAIPALRNLAAQEDNQLLKTAYTSENIEASELLLEITEVREEAARHNYYSEEIFSKVNITEIVADKESATRNFTPSEKLAFECVLRRYNAQMQQLGGPENVFQILKDYLAEQYRKSPAQITLDGTSYTLPLDASSVLPSLIEKIGPTAQLDESIPALTAEQEKAAMLAYYDSKYHTALRFLSIPNPLLHEDAMDIVHRYRPDDEDPTEYTKSLQKLHNEKLASHPGAKLVEALIAGNAANPEIAYAWFEGHIEKFAYLWLACTDTTEPERDGFNTERRIEFFITELSKYMGRAHNWDTKRHNPSTGKEEEFDDLEGDIPTCYVGMPKRLIQAVPAHSAFTMPTVTELQQHARDLARAHFKELFVNLSLSECSKLFADINDYFITLDFTNATNLIIPEAKIAALIKQVQDNAPSCYSPFIKAQLEDIFRLKHGNLNHLLQFYLSFNLDELLKAQNDENNECEREMLNALLTTPSVLFSADAKASRKRAASTASRSTEAQDEEEQGEEEEATAVVKRSRRSPSLI